MSLSKHRMSWNTILQENFTMRHEKCWILTVLGFETMNSRMVSKTSLFVVLQIVQLKYFFWTQCYCYFKRNLIQIVWNIDYSTWKSNVFRTDAINQEKNCFERAVRYLILIPIIALWQRLTTLVYPSQGQAT